MLKELSLSIDFDGPLFPFKFDDHVHPLIECGVSLGDSKLLSAGQFEGIAFLREHERIDVVTDISFRSGRRIGFPFI